MSTDINTKTTPFERALVDIDLPAIKKRILLERYNTLLIKMDSQAFRLSITFHSSRCIVTIGSLIVPALLSIQYTSTAGTNLGIYWMTWALSLLVTICNGLSSLLKIDKNYYHIHTVREQLISDGWQYLELTGKYSGFHTPTQHATHENQFIFFCHSIEKIRMKQIQEDYYKVNEAQGQGQGQGQAQGQGQPTAKVIPTTILPPTPLQGELQNVPSSIRRVLEQLSQSPVGDGQGPNEENQKDGETTSVPVQR